MGRLCIVIVICYDDGSGNEYPSTSQVRHVQLVAWQLENASDSTEEHCSAVGCPLWHNAESQDMNLGKLIGKLIGPFQIEDPDLY